MKDDTSDALEAVNPLPPFQRPTSNMCVLGGWSKSVSPQALEHGTGTQESRPKLHLRSFVSRSTSGT
jgi:hypothetical protein